MVRPPHRRALLLAWGLVACAGGCSDELKDPLIEALLPDKGAPGALVDLVGERFTATRGAVSFGGRPAKVLIWTPQRARVQVPDAGLFGWTLVVLTAQGRPSNAVSFFVQGDPPPDGGLPDVGPIPDLPWTDGPLGDGPLGDGPLADGPLVDGLLVDGPLVDGPPVDAGTPDLAPDLPTSDVWTDSMVPDTSADVATPDAGVADAINTDAPTPDATAPDASTPDAAAPDAGAPDAASGDI